MWFNLLKLDNMDIIMVQKTQEINIIGCVAG